MKRLISVLMAALALCWVPAAPAVAQQQSQVVSACGTNNQTPPTGTFSWNTMTADGKACVSSPVTGPTTPVTQSGLWNVGGFSFFVSTTPTIQNASYVSGNCMGGFQAVTVTGTTGATGTLHAFSITSKGGLLTAKQVYVFSQNPSASTCTDKSTFTINTADWSKLITTFSITPAAATGTTGTYADNTSMGRAFATSANGNLYVAIVETTTETPASTTDLNFTLGGYIDKP